MIRARNALGHLCERLAVLFEEWSRRLIVCPECGRGLFYGRPCKEGNIGNSANTKGV